MEAKLNSNRLNRKWDLLGSKRHSIAIDLCLILFVVTVSFFIRMTDLPIVGEEGRRARGAVNMVESGDWIVVRQQGLVFPDRPPMTNWLIALVSQVTGEVDKIAIRTPSTIAILLTAFLLYWYGRRCSTRLTSISAALVYVTFGQVLQLGRLGESEAVFTLLIAASLLVWHAGYLAKWPAVYMWCAGYSFAALGALVKGIQAPIYFCAPVCVFLLYNREWRRGLTLSHGAGVGCFALILGLWQVPYLLATDMTAVQETWFDVVGPRLGSSGLISHLIEFPFETLGCLLPWSPLMLALISPKVRRAIAGDRSTLAFLLIAILMTYPSVWFASGAKGRYYMPMYPVFALIIGLVINLIATSDYATGNAKFWRHALRTGMIIVAGAGVTLAIGLGFGVDQLRFLAQSPGVVAIFVTSMLFALTKLVQAHRANTKQHAYMSVVAFSLFVGMFYNCIVVGMHSDHWHDITYEVREIKQEMEHTDMISFGPVDHRFAYPYQNLILEVDWPESVKDVPKDLDYFCFNRTRGDTPETRFGRRGMKVWSTSGTLPFEWEEVGRVCCDRVPRGDPDCAVIVGRIIRTNGELTASQGVDASWK